MANYASLVDDYKHTHTHTHMHESSSGGRRSSAESSDDGFSFATSMDLRKNLTATFDQQVAVVTNTAASASAMSASAMSASASATTTTTVSSTKHVAKPSAVRTSTSISTSISISTSTTDSSSVVDRIAQFEAAATSAAVAACSSSHSRPPLPLPLGAPPSARDPPRNAVPRNGVAVYLRIRPPVSSDKDKQNDKKACLSASASTSTSTSLNLNLNTIEVLKPTLPTIHPTSVRTYPPPQSNASRIHSHRALGHDSNSSSSSNMNNNMNNNMDTCAKQFEFHQVLQPGATQKTVYSTIAAPLFQSLFDATASASASASASATEPPAHPNKDNHNHNNQKEKEKDSPPSALLFSYGITNAGKTHTILGDIKSTDDANWGVIPRAISDIFQRLRQMPKMPKTQQYDLYISYFEIYNEQVYDLVPRTKVLGPPPPLKVRERHGQTLVRGLARHRVKDVKHGIDITAAANNRRHTSSNNLNAGSSRSHCVCQMQLVPRSHSTVPLARTSKLREDDSVASLNGYSTDEEAALLSTKKISTVWIVDLAGSERSKRTGMGLARQKEASQINKSLMTLMRCLTVMRQSSRTNSSNIVPFRESKLTHVFMGHLTGTSAARTAMIVNVNPAVSDFDETQHVLAYAAQAKFIQMNPEDFKHKRTQFFGGDDEYGMDGRKKKKVVTKRPRGQENGNGNGNCNGSGVLSKTASGLRGFVQRLSPKKKLMKLLSPTTKARLKQEKRKIAVSNETNSNNDNDSSHILQTLEPSFKRRKVASKKKPISTKQKTDPSISLRMELAATKSELEEILGEKNLLLEELQQQETHIRMEVSEEMEQQLRRARERNNGELQRLRSQLNAVTTSSSLPSSSSQYPQSTHKAQMDQVERHIEELMDKVDECEAEMERMRDDYAVTIQTLTHHHATELAQLQAELETTRTCARAQSPVTSKSVTFAATKSQETSRRVRELERQVEVSRREIELLTKSKKELVSNYEHLLRSQEEDEGEDQEEEDEEEEENRVPLWKQKLTRKGKSPHIRKALGNVSNNNNKKAPLVAIDGSISKGHKEQQWIFPKKPSQRNQSNGTYPRPMGRPPQGREWDQEVGAWKMTMMLV